jgi:CRISPR-associated protein Cst2
MTNNVKKGLTATVIIEAESLNYDEGFKNVSILKKIRRADGGIYTFASRQSLRYSIVKQGIEQFGWKLAEVELVKGKGAGEGVTQHKYESSIKDSEEIDLFGYMKTKSAQQEEETHLRLAPVRLTPAISLEPFYSDIEFMNNKWMADRVPAAPNIANIEHHRSLYKYTVTIDLDRIGTEEWNWTLDENGKKVMIEPEDRAKRINQFLEILKTLYRDIRGRREDLKPLFIIGGVYDIKNPFFMNAVIVEWVHGKPVVLDEPIKQIFNADYYVGNEKISIKNSTVLGVRSGIFGNEDKLKQLLEGADTLPSPELAIDTLKQKVNEYFGVNKK